MYLIRYVIALNSSASKAKAFKKIYEALQSLKKSEDVLL